MYGEIYVKSNGKVVNTKNVDMDDLSIDRHYEKRLTNNELLWVGDYDETKAEKISSTELINCEEYPAICELVWGGTVKTFSNKKPYEIESMLTHFLNKNVRLTAVLKCCVNSDSYWEFYYE